MYYEIPVKDLSLIGYYENLNDLGYTKEAVG